MELTGKQLIQEAIVDWLQFGSNQPFSEWFTDASWILPERLYRCDDDLSHVEEIPKHDDKFKLLRRYLLNDMREYARIGKLSVAAGVRQAISELDALEDSDDERD